MQEQLLALSGAHRAFVTPVCSGRARTTRKPYSIRARRGDLFDLAAAYAFGLAKNHPFVDGNKRIGFATAVVFLELNGSRFEAGESVCFGLPRAHRVGEEHLADKYDNVRIDIYEDSRTS